MATPSRDAAHASGPSVTVRAPLTDLLLLVYRRRPPHGEGVEVLGDDGLLDFWLGLVAFG